MNGHTYLAAPGLLVIKPRGGESGTFVNVAAERFHDHETHEEHKDRFPSCPL